MNRSFSAFPGPFEFACLLAQTYESTCRNVVIGAGVCQTEVILSLQWF